MMKEILSSRVNKMAISETLAMAAKARELRSQGVDVIGLSLGEPDFNIPEFIKQAAIKAVEDNYSKYSPVDGYPDLKQSICNKFKRDNGLHYKPSQIVVSTGAKQVLANVALSMLNKGDEVILPAPYWVSYRDIVRLSGGVEVEIPTSIKNDFKITAEQLEKSITPRTKMLWFSSPCNPTGSVYSREELEDLSWVLQKYPNIYILSDEIYEHINFTGQKHVSIASVGGLYDRVVTVNGVSKAFAMTGWRIGYMGASEQIAKACTKIQGQITSGANDIAQRATIVALEAPVSKIQYMIDEFRVRRDLILSLLSEIEGFNVNCPQGAFYVFPDVSFFFGKQLRGRYIGNATDFSMYLLEEAHVATVTGSAFGDDNCIRISYAASQQQIKEAIRRIKEVLC